jgi:hypothetical protein
MDAKLYLILVFSCILWKREIKPPVRDTIRVYKNESISLLESNSSEQMTRDKISYKLQSTTESIVYSFSSLFKSSSSEICSNIIAHKVSDKVYLKAAAQSQWSATKYMV